MAWDVDGAERRMDIIGQNGNEGLHYDAEDDYGTFRRVVEDKNKSNNTQTKYGGKNKKRNTGKKSAIVEHQKHPPHKH